MKIYVTGLGVVSGIGIGVSENIEALRQRKHGIGKVTLFPTALDVPVSEVKRSNEELKQLISLPPQRTVSRTALLGMIAAKEAMKDAGLTPPLRIGFISATSVGGMDLSEHFYESFKKNPGQGRLREVISHDCGASTELIASYLGINDFITTISTACSSAANAIMLGARMIKHGLLDAAIVGGTDALCRFTLNGFNSLMILDKTHCRPFDRSRTGLNLGEGAGYLVLQSESSLQRTPYCELSGYANTNEAYHQTGSSPEGDGAFLSMSEAIASSGISLEKIDYINVHGTSTPVGDVSEVKAIKDVFGDHAYKLNISSTKSMTGHLLGAAGAVEAIASVLAVKNDIVPPTINHEEGDNDENIDYNLNFTFNEAQKRTVNAALSNTFGFGGHNACVIVKKYAE